MWINQFLKKIEFNIITFCWEWNGKTNEGYARYNKKYIHRVFYEYWRGKIPDGFVLDHLCRNRKCVNPTHLEIVTRGENVRRGIRKTYQQYCKNGHRYNLENTVYFNGKKQKKRCIICTQIWVKRTMENKKLVMV